MSATIEKDIFGHNFTVGTVVSVRCVVTSITPKGLPGLVYFIVQVQTRTGQSTKFAVPFQI